MLVYDLHTPRRPVRLGLEYPETAAYFGAWLCPAAGKDPGLSLRGRDWSYARRAGLSRCAETEFSLLSGAVSEALLPEGIALFHAAAIRFRDRAWLLAGPSGVGKSTQARTLRELYPGAFGVISGDRPVLALTEGGVWVHPSPWNGKEGWHGAEAAPLAGIVCLQRGEENALSLLTPRSAALTVYGAVIHNAASPDVIRAAAAFAEELIDRVPVWQLANAGVPDSTRLLYESVLAQEEI